MNSQKEAKIWLIDYVKGGYQYKKCNLNDVPQKLYHSAHRAKCNECRKNATEIVEGTITDIGCGKFIKQFPLCEEHYLNLML